jgi:hypothetical protein
MELFLTMNSGGARQPVGAELLSTQSTKHGILHQVAFFNQPHFSRKQSIIELMDGRPSFDSDGRVCIGTPRVLFHRYNWLLVGSPAFEITGPVLQK